MFSILMRFLEFVRHVGACCHGPRDSLPPSSSTDPPNHASPSLGSAPLSASILREPEEAAATDVAVTAAASPLPGESMTENALNILISHLENWIERFQSTSGVDENAPPGWEEYISAADFERFLRSLDKKQKVTPAQITKDTVLPLLEKVLGGIDSLHWAAFACSMLAWGIDMLSKQHQNFKDCFEVLKRTVFLLKNAKFLWVHEDQIIDASRSLRMTDTLPEVAAVAFTASAICVSCSGDRDYASLVTRYLGAPTLEESLRELRDRITSLETRLLAIGQQNVLLGQQEVMQRLEGNSVMSRTVSRYLTLDGKNSTIERTQLLAEVERKLTMDDNKQEEIVAVCLHGMGGVGKSTLAFTIFNQLLSSKKHEFVFCHVEMELESEQKDIPRFQRQILQTLLSPGKEGGVEIKNALHGREMLLRQFREKSAPILLYIDNVENPEHLVELLPPKQLPMGSRLLITSRNERARAYLEQLGVKEDRCHSIEVKTLDEAQSRQLLRKEALIKVEDKEIVDRNPTLTDLEKRVLRLCDGLPLALKLMGSFIAYSTSEDGEGAGSPETWEHVVSAMKRASPVDGSKNDGLYARLKLSIDALHESLRSVLFELVRWKLYYEWDMDELNVIFGALVMKNLLDRHLLEVVEHRWHSGILRVGCHDIIASLVERMASTSSEDADLGNIVVIGRSRIMYPKVDIEDVELAQMKRLRYASLETVDLAKDGSAAVPEIDLPHLKALRIVEMRGRGLLKLRKCPELRLLSIVHALPDDVDIVLVEAGNLRRLDVDSRDLGRLVPCIRRFSALQSLSVSSVEDWDGLFFTLTALTELHLKDCSSLLCIPDGICKITRLSSLHFKRGMKLAALPEGISMLTNLRKLYLEDCVSLQCLPEGVQKLHRLEYLYLVGCKRLAALPEGISGITNLKKLYLEDCVSLQCLPEGVQKLNSLEHISLHGCKSLVALPEGISMLTNLWNLNLTDCRSLQCLPEGVQKLNRLEYLSLIRCKSLAALPEGISGLTNLERLDLKDCVSLQCLPEGVQKLNRLEDLGLRGCKSFAALPEGISMLTNLKGLDLRDCVSLQCLPEGIQKLNRLEYLSLIGCKSLAALPEGISMLTNLRKLHLKDCVSLQCLPEGVQKLNRLEYLMLTGCKNLAALPEGMSGLMNLKELYLEDCVSLQFLPEGIQKLNWLEYLDLEGCKSLAALPEGISGLTNLDRLDLRDCVSLQCIPEGVQKLNRLEYLFLEGCKSLAALPEGISGLMNLKELHLKDCVSLQCLPEGIQKLTRLSCLDLDGCKSLAALPGGISGLMNLMWLNLTDCISLQCLPEGIQKLTALLSLNLLGCKSLAAIPEGISGLTKLNNVDLKDCVSLQCLPKGI